MNFENYNKIYQEILDDESNDLSANYLLNKYKIKHDEELINILNQIKKNEYISSSNSVVNKLLSELDNDDDLLDINEIIDIKEKVITEDLDTEFVSYTSEVEEEIKIEKNTKNKKKKKKKANQILNNIKDNINLKYAIPFLIIFIVSIVYFNTSNDTQASEEIASTVTPNNEKNIINENKKVASNDTDFNITKIELKKNKPAQVTHENKQPEEDIKISTNEDLSKKEVQIVKNETKPTPIETTESIDKDKVEEKLDQITTYEVETPDVQEAKVQEENPIDLAQLTISNEPPAAGTITLNSLNELDGYIDEFSYHEGKLLFENHEYSEDDSLLGFKIYKLTPIYVKFQDEKNHMRKRILFKN